MEMLVGRHELPAAAQGESVAMASQKVKVQYAGFDGRPSRPVVAGFMQSSRCNAQAPELSLTRVFGDAGGSWGDRA